MIKLAFYNLFRRKARTVLALAALVIGIGSLVIMIGMVDGIYAETTKSVSALQGIIAIEEGKVDDSLSFISDTYPDQLKSVKGVKLAIPNIVGLLDTVDEEPTSIMALIGTPAATLRESYVGEIVSKITKGRSLKSNDSGVVLISDTIAERYKKSVGNSVKLNGKRFKIIGIGELTSELYSTIFVVTLEDAKEVLDFPKGQISSVYLKLHNPADASKVAQIVEFKFEGELDAYTQQDFAELIGEFLGNFRIVTTVIALISAFVAAVVVMNTMLMSVLERFKEIGVLEAVGWTNDDIVKMIMLEVFFLGLLGGIGAVLLAVVAGFALFNTFGLTVLLTPELMVGSVGFSIVVSLVAGVYPAYRAIKMNPIDAIREE